jgi:hypothetical protein
MGYVMSTPTPYYYGLRAELFLHDAEQALKEGKKEKHSKLILRAAEYRRLAGMLPLEEIYYEWV